MKKVILGIFLVILISSFVSSFCSSTYSISGNGGACSSSQCGATRCSGNTIQECKSYYYAPTGVTDYYWMPGTTCTYGCSGGVCLPNPSCSNACSPAGTKTCATTTSYKTCGECDSDSCLDWCAVTSCGTQTCASDYYTLSGTNSATSTSTCYKHDYPSTCSKTCSGAGICSSCTCTASTVSQATAGLCKYINGCSGGTPGTVANYADGTYCGTGKICQSGNCITAPTCTGTPPANSVLCSGDNTGLTATTPITLVDSCGTPKCEYVCNIGYAKSGDSCVAVPQCTGTIPANSQLCSGDDTGLTINTTRTLRITCTEAKCEYICNAGYVKSGSSCVVAPTNQICTGSAYSCSNYNSEIDCFSQQGCSWNSMLQTCSGTAISCDLLYFNDCSNQDGCTWITLTPSILSGNDCNTYGTDNETCLATGNNCTWTPPKSTTGHCCGYHEIWNDIAGGCVSQTSGGFCYNVFNMGSFNLNMIKLDVSPPKYCANIANDLSYGLWEDVESY